MSLALSPGAAAAPAAYADRAFTDVFSALSGAGWLGGDIESSVRLPDGRTAWFVGDTITASSSSGVRFVRNSVVLTGRGRPVVIMNPLPALGDGSFFWPAAARVDRWHVWVLGHRIVETGRGLWGFRAAGTWLAQIDLGSWRLQSLRRVVGEGGKTSWGVALFDNGAYTYIYGLEADGMSTWLHVARVQRGRLDRPWRFYAGSSWAGEPGRSIRVLAGVSAVSLLDLGRSGLRLISQQPVLGRLVYSWRARSPVGPFTNRRVIYDTGSFGEHTYTYNTLAHPQDCAGGAMLFSFNVNSYDVLTPATAPLYRPRFFRMSLAAI